MTDKKLTVKRLVIFCVIAFLPFIVIVPILNAHYGEPIYECEEAAAAVYALGVFGMLIPSISNIITRLVTKEGFKNSYLGLNIEKNGKYYAAAVWVQLAETVLGSLLIWLVFLNGMSFSEVFVFDDMKANTGAILLTIAASIILFFPGFGEEWGWRGYMMPKLFELMPKPAAIVVGGIIWGLWHAPLTVSGHNFPTDHTGYPFVGILLMCLFCILANAFLTFITERTRSIYPASFSHMVNNNFAAGSMFILFGTEATIEKVSDISNVSAILVTLPVSAVVAVISVIMLMKKEKGNA